MNKSGDRIMTSWFGYKKGNPSSKIGARVQAPKKGGTSSSLFTHDDEDIPFFSLNETSSAEVKVKLKNLGRDTAEINLPSDDDNSDEEIAVPTHSTTSSHSNPHAKAVITAAVAEDSNEVHLDTTVKTGEDKTLEAVASDFTVTEIKPLADRVVEQQIKDQQKKPTALEYLNYCINKRQYSYSNFLNAFKALNEGECSDVATRIIQQINDAVIFLESVKDKSFAEMSPEELGQYFLYISELDHYSQIIDHFSCLRDYHSILNRFPELLKDNAFKTPLKSYQAKKAAFFKYMTIVQPTAFQNYYDSFSHVYNALYQLSAIQKLGNNTRRRVRKTQETTFDTLTKLAKEQHITDAVIELEYTHIHAELKEHVDDYEKTFQFILAEHYLKYNPNNPNAITPDAYTNTLITLFDFLETLKGTRYSDSYKRTALFLCASLLNFITGSQGKFNWKLFLKLITESIIQKLGENSIEVNEANIEQYWSPIPFVQAVEWEVISNNQGWDVYDRIEILRSTTEYVPAQIRKACKKSIVAIQASALEMKEHDGQRLTNNPDSFTIIELTDRLASFSEDLNGQLGTTLNEGNFLVYATSMASSRVTGNTGNFSEERLTYADRVKELLTQKITTAVTTVTSLLDEQLQPSGNLTTALIALDSIWLELRHYSNLNATMHPRFACLVKLQKFYTTYIPAITKQFEAVLPHFDAALLKKDNLTAFLPLAQSLPMMPAFLSLLTSENKGHDDSLYANIFKELDPHYLGYIQRVIVFYRDLRDQFTQAERNKNFSEMYQIWSLLNANSEVINNFLDIILDPKNKAALEEAGIQFYTTKIGDKETPTELKIQMKDLASRLREDAMVSVSLPENYQKATSASKADREEFYSTIFQAYEGLKSYHHSSVYMVFGQQDRDVIALLNSVKENIRANLDIIKEPAIRVLEGEFPSFNKESYNTFNTAYESLITAKNLCKDPEISAIINASIESFSNQVKARLDAFYESITANNNASVEEIINCLIKLQIMDTRINVGKFVTEPGRMGMADRQVFKKYSSALIHDVLTAVLNSKFTQCNIQKLGDALQSVTGPNATEAGQLLTHPMFSSLATALRNRETAAQDIDYICGKLEENAEKNTNLISVQLKGQYGRFEEAYWERVQRGLEANTLASKEELEEILRSQVPYTDKIISVAASLFARWSVEDYKEKLRKSGLDPSAATMSEGLQADILKPHPAQILAIFRLLGMNVAAPYPNNPDIQAEVDLYIQNHLAEIKTGEGKSITLAVTAQIFALMGYDVDVACYSNYLSERDFEDFTPMFQAMGLQDNIYYGTFKQLSERQINAQHGDLRDNIGDRIRGIDGTHSAVTAATTKHIQRKKILLVDEVDVFLGKSICGDTYSLSSVFETQEAINIVLYVLANAALSTLDLDSVKAHCHKDYNTIVQRSIKGFDRILDQTILAMIDDAKIYNVDNGTFEFNDVEQKIGYRTQGHDMEYNVTYRYQTMFAYLNCYKQGKINTEQLRGKIGLLIQSGEFSYAEMIKEYDHVLGVTGTLSTLGKTEKSYLESVLQVQNFTYLPSAYTENHVEFPTDISVKCVLAKSHFATITEEIKINATSLSGGPLRPMFLFFETPEELSAYNKWLTKRNDFPGREIIFLDAQDTNEERKAKIRRATSPGAILLTTKEFGRGTDFQVFDPEINAAGGPHVIMTFLSDDIAEETQIIGRTARQGKNGTCSMVLNARQLNKKYGLQNTTPNIESYSGIELYRIINEARTKALDEQQQRNSEVNAKIKVIHDKSKALAKNLDQNSAATKSGASASSTSISTFTGVREYVFGSSSSVIPQKSTRDKEFMQTLVELNQFKAALPKRTHAENSDHHTVILIDATSSMKDLLEAVKKTVREMFTRAKTVIEQAEGDSEDRSEMVMQLVFYRNYGDDKILECSQWVRMSVDEDLEELDHFLATITATGGFPGKERYLSGLEATEAGLAYINQEVIGKNIPLKQVIWMGDVGPNLTEELPYKRAKMKHSAAGTPYEQQVNFEDELQKLIAKKIPVHAVQVGNETSQTQIYRSTATKTQGKFHQLNPHSTTAAAELTDLVVESVLQDIGGNDYVNRYRFIYRPSYTGPEVTRKSASIGKNPVGVFSNSSTAPHSKVSSSTFASVQFFDRTLIRKKLTEQVNKYRDLSSTTTHEAIIARAQKILTNLEAHDITDQQISDDYSAWIKMEQAFRKLDAHVNKYSTWGALSHQTSISGAKIILNHIRNVEGVSDAQISLEYVDWGQKGKGNSDRSKHYEQFAEKSYDIRKDNNELRR